MEQSVVAQTDSIEAVINGEDVGENTRKYLSFMVDGDIYAFNALQSKKLLSMRISPRSRWCQILFEV